MDAIGSDRGPRLSAAVIWQLTKQGHLQKHLSTSYCPWGNETVKKIFEEMLRVSWSFLKAFPMDPTSWSAVIDCVHAIINQARFWCLEGSRNTKELKCECAMEVFTRLKQKRLMVQCMLLRGFLDCDAIEEEKAKEIIRSNGVFIALHLLHKKPS